MDDGKRYRERSYEEQTSKRLRHQNLSGKSGAAIKKKVSRTATTKPTAFAAFTAAALPEPRR
jgi:hypothetical protein